MKKRIVIVTSCILFVLANLIVTKDGEAKVKTIKMSKKYAYFLKKGYVGNTSAHLGMTYKQIKKKENGYLSEGERFLFHNTQRAAYGFYFKKSSKISQTRKISLIERRYKGKIPHSEVRKYFKRVSAITDGKVDQTIYYYKVGNYYLEVDYFAGNTMMRLGAKKAINNYYLKTTIQ